MRNIAFINFALQNGWVIVAVVGAIAVAVLWILYFTKFRK